MNLGVGNHNQVGMPSSSVSWKSGEVSDKFPAGLRVLVVDDDPTCLMILEKMLRNCRYEVTKCNRAEVALSLLRENRNGFDVVISDVHMPDMDGFKLLEDIGLEMDLPVIMMSADDSKHVVMKGVTHGACDYLIKPVRMEALKNIWQHVVRKRKNEWKDFEPSSACVDDGERAQKVTEDADYSSSANEGSWKNSKRRKDEDDEGEERDDSSSLKKPRVVWSVELHQQFVAAVNQLGIDKAVPKKILELMNVPGLTRENVASHLQKYRLYLKRLSGTQHPGGLNAPFMGPTDPSFAAMSSLSGLDLHTLAASGQLPAQSLATLQAAALGRSSAKSHISDQRNLFSFENPKYRYGEGQQQLLNNNNKQMNLLHGIPTNMEAKQLAGLHQTPHSFGGMSNQVNAHGSHNGPVLIPMGHHPQSRQPILSNGLGSGVLARNGMVDNVREAVYSPISQSSSSRVDFSVNQKTVDNVFPIGTSSITGISPLQDDANVDMKVPRGVIPGYDIFNDLNQAKPQDSWGLPNAGLSFSSSQNANMQSLIHSQNHVSSSFGKPMFSAGEEIVNQNRMNIAQQPYNTFIGDNQLRIKPERLVGGHNNMFHEQYGGHDDLFSVVLKQQQEGIGQVDNEFNFDGYNLDNLPV